MCYSKRCINKRLFKDHGAAKEQNHLLISMKAVPSGCKSTGEAVPHIGNSVESVLTIVHTRQSECLKHEVDTLVLLDRMLLWVKDKDPIQSVVITFVPIHNTDCKHFRCGTGRADREVKKPNDIS